MKKALIISIVMVLALAFSTAAFAQEKQAGFWDKMKNKVETLAPKKTTTVTTAVGGVRGAKEDISVMYWKNDEGSVVVTEAEMAKFNEALDLAMRNMADQATTKFQEFMNMYPNSALKADAENALTNLQAAK